MTNEELIELKKYIGTLNEDEKIERDVYLRKVALGEIEGTMTGYASVDKPWLQYYPEETIKKKIPKLTIYDQLKLTARDCKGYTAIHYLGNNITFDKLIENIDSYAKGFKKLGVKRGDVVTIALPNTPENTYCIYALNKLGAVANLIDPRTKGEDLKDAIGELNSKVFVGSSVFFNNINEAGLDNVENIIISSPSDSMPFALKKLYDLKNKVKLPKNSKYISWKRFKLDSSLCKDEIESKYIKNSTACVLHTSGTTGKSKSVALTNENFNTFTVEYSDNAIFDLEKSNRFLNEIPPFLAFNIAMATHMPLSLGMEIVMIPDYQPEKIVKHLTKYKINHAVVGPADCYSILEHSNRKNVDLSSLKTFACGSDKLNETQKVLIEEELKRRGSTSKIVEGYGMTEVSSGATTNLRNKNIASSVGTPLPKMNICIVDPDTGKELKYGEEGEICISGPTVMKEYINNPEDTNYTKRIHEDNAEWVHTGDLGSMDKDGFIYFIGRIKRIVVRHDGFKIFPIELERVINRHPYVENSCVVAVKDEENGRGYVPAANIVLKEEYLDSDEEFILDDIRNYCLANMKEGYSPKFYVIRKALPLTPVGKVDYRSLEKENYYEKAEKRVLK